MDRYGTVGAVIAAAGSSSRMGGRDKLAEPLDGIPVILRTLAAVEAVPEIREIVVVTREDRVEEYRRLLGQCSRLRAVVPGGSTRQESVRNGVRALSPDCTLAAIHDGARPLVTPEVFARCIEAARSCGAATAAVPVKDTIKLADEAGRVLDTPDRSRLWAVQTPQIFDRERYLRAAEEAERRGLSCTDDCQLFEAVGWEVQLVMGDYRNLKLTTPEDFLAAGAYLEGIK
ncbi:2-C-methyl-D-erythritol 4-phosphate cytidylyltransferase [Hydrogenoanaerobacterium saccharovorans]|uniref:2-C-methyl-D-erythritol 4-phosphate cytidylyltransferase n=1 Tax=Hydrogenoanaerobacterium saccharovorans TaxID=474960 RepID=A0ABS2GMN8_9FIRM|nr:2-C-methyl-D-erythritol 4-phosphate cytidylyltransferase [Hydrogenoanaerobacterium saccharovorans]MBM6923361.1 2-C-methyl-D-erythritol 4-phosphate cytidylyltransferase [Hydrogenoanaerobacterium saccharovorans]